MDTFYNTPLFRSETQGEDNPHLLTFENSEIDLGQIQKGLEHNQLALIRSTSFEDAGALFGDLVDHYDLRDSYDLQMQLVVEMMEAREGIDDVAVTVNDRGPFQMIQPHSEGDSTSQLDLFGLYCVQNTSTGGENVLSLIDQSADHSRLRAKEKAVVGQQLSDFDIHKLRENHLDATDVLSSLPPESRVLWESPKGSVVVRPVPLSPSKSVLSGEDLFTYWDNVTVHDHAFHKLQYELLNHLGILQKEIGDGYEFYMHVEDDSDWAPADTESGTVEQTSALFSAHVLHKMQSGDFLLFNNRAWTHSVNNWNPNQTRKLNAMYA